MTLRKVMLVVLSGVALAGVVMGSAASCNPAFTAARQVQAPAHYAPTHGVVRSPREQPILFANVDVWSGEGSSVLHSKHVRVEGERITSITDTAPLDFAGRVIDGRGKTLIPGLIDTHVHLLYGSGPELLRDSQGLISDWLDATDRGNRVPDVAYERGELRLLAGVTTVRILGDGMYSLHYRDEIASGRRVGPRVLTAGLHVNGPQGYVTAGVARGLPERDQEHIGIEIRSKQELGPKIAALLAAGVDVVKIATTHGDMGFREARPDLPEDWVREIVRLAHAQGRKVVAHSYGNAGDWAAVHGGVDGIEHLVNVPVELDDALIAAIKAQGIWVCPTLSGSAYSIKKLIEDPGWLNRDPGVVAHVDARTRKRLLETVGIIGFPGFTRFVLGEANAKKKWEHWYRQSIANTRKLHVAGVKLVFGTDVPFTMGNFFHSVGNEIEALRMAGVPDLGILEMATSRAAEAIGLAREVGRVEEGFVADLVLLRSSPLDDLKAALDDLEMVVARGRVVVEK